MTALLQAPEVHTQLPPHAVEPPEPTHEQIAERAYARYLAHGCSDGCDMDDWLAAESELRDKVAAGQLDDADLECVVPPGRKVQV